MCCVSVGYVLSCLADMAADEDCKSGEEVAGEGSDQYADKDIAEVVSADEDAADCYHKGPEEHPVTIGLEPSGHTGGSELTFRLGGHVGRRSHEAALHAKECAEG